MGISVGFTSEMFNETNKGYNLLFGDKNPILDASYVNFNQMNDVMKQVRSVTNPFALTLDGIQRAKPDIYFMRRRNYTGGGGEIARFTNQYNLSISDKYYTYTNFKYSNLYGAYGVLNMDNPNECILPASLIKNPAYYIETLPVDTEYTYQMYIPKNTDLIIQGDGISVRYDFYNSNYPTSIKGADIKDYVIVKTPKLYIEVGDHRALPSITEPFGYYAPVLFMPFNAYEFINPETNKLTKVDCDGVYLYDLYGAVGSKYDIGNSSGNQIGRVGLSTNTIYEMSLGGGDTTYDSRFDVLYDVDGRMFVKKSSLTTLLNYVGIPWSYDIEQIKYTINPLEFTDGYKVIVDPVNPDNKGQGDNQNGGGDGNGDNKNDSFEFINPSIDPSTATTNTYVMNSNQVRSFINELYNGTFWTNIELLTKNPKECIIDLSAWPINLLNHDLKHVGVSEVIKCGNVELTTAHGQPMLNGYNKVINVGEIKIEKYFGSFLDYKLTKIDLFLPFIGWHSLSTENVMGRLLRVKYVMNFEDASIVAFVTSVDNEGTEFLEDVYNASLGFSVPVFTSNHNEKEKQKLMLLLSAGAATVAGVAGAKMAGGALGMQAVSGATQSVGSSVAQVALLPDHTVSGAMPGSNATWYLPNKCILKITRPTKSEAEKFTEYEGRPANYSVKLSETKGFTQIDNPVLSGITATEDEKQEIISLLQRGVYI